MTEICLLSNGSTTSPPFSSLDCNPAFGFSAVMSGIQGVTFVKGPFYCEGTLQGDVSLCCVSFYLKPCGLSCCHLLAISLARF